MQNVTINHRWISAEEYAKQTGLGAEKVKQFIRAGKIEGEQTEGGYWKVKVYKDDAVSKEVYDRAMTRITELETTLTSMQNIMKGVI